MKTSQLMAAVVGALTLGVACGGGVSSDEQARRAYLGLDKSIAKSMQLGFDGFNAASSANISPQTTTGDKSGTLTITGQVDQGNSANKGMRLKVAMSNYSDGDLMLDGGISLGITYVTPVDGGAAPSLDLSLKGIPNGTLTGSLSGEYAMSGDLSGLVKLDLAMSGQLAPGDGGTVQRKPGTTTVTGTATSFGGTYQVNLTL